ncbi:MAG: endolytic transglycosylase MltG, partial [Armatimonadota bacterium]
MSRWKLLIAIVALLLASGGLAGGLWLRSALQPVGSTEQQLFRVPSGSSGGSVAGALQRAGLIRDARAFKIGLRIWGMGAELKPGYYDVSADMSPKAIAQKIASGDTAKWRLTIPEGFTAEQIAQRAAE